MLEFNDDLIVRYLENACSEEEEMSLLEWLKSSEENTIAFLTFKKIYNLRKIKRYSDQTYINNALLKFDLRIESDHREQKRKSLLRFTKYAAILLLGILIPAIYLLYIKEKPVELITVNVNASDQIKTILLPDGSKVWINNGSSFIYPASFSRNERKVTIIGEAYFEVKPDSLHPFLVETKAISVRVLGTSFNVNTKTADSTIETTLVKGKVIIQNNLGKDMLQLLPGQMARFNSKTQAVSVNDVNTNVYTSWRNGLLVFYKATLNEITEKIENFYHVKITINSKNPIQNKYNFVFRRTQPLSTVLEMLKFVAPITYRKYDEQVYINLK